MAAPPTPDALLATLAAMRRELGQAAGAPVPALDDDLERTLGIDSLARMELMLRLERTYGVRLDEQAVQLALTPRDLWRAVAAAPQRSAVAAAAPPVALPAGETAALEAPQRAATLVDVLQWHAARAPGHRHVTLLPDGDEAGTVLTHAALLERAGSVAAALQRRGVEPGDRVALMLPTGIDFFTTFAGVLVAGAVPVPIYPPLRPSQLEDHLRRQARLLDNAQAVLLVCDAPALRAARVLRAGVASLRGVEDAGTLERDAGAAASPPSCRALDTALLQYTSGSTGQPKGVVLTHANLLANVRAMGVASDAGPGDVFVSWLPLYHDMGLIGAWLGSLYFGIPLVVMPTQAFLARPSRWLRALHRHRGTLSAAPNFAYEIVAARVPDDELQGLDLAAWRIAFNGAEPVQPATLERFAARFARCGFDARASTPVYGLAENGVGLAFPPPGRGPRIDAIDRDALHERARAEPATGERAMRIVSCGVPLPGHQIRIVDAHGRELPERGEGRIEFRGPSATGGYFRNPEATRALFDGDWLDTGDVGYLAGGELYLTSRVKDLIIRGGHNIHPYDLEAAVGELPGVRKGCVAVFGVADTAAGTERVVVMAEARESDAQRRAALRERIAGLAVALLGAPADDIVLVDAHVVPKTSSGKIRRGDCRELYLRGAVRAPRRSLRSQLARLWLRGLAQRSRARWRDAAAALDAAWLWTLFGIAAMLGVAVAALPGRARRQRLARGIARALLRATGVPVRFEGGEHLPSGPAIVVANHASYVDWLLLTAVLPAGAAFVAKRELARGPLLRRLLERIGTRFVARDDVRAGVEDAQRLVAAAQAGESLVFFPEGTLTREPGLRPFYLGAFVVSATSGLPLLPVALRGTRSVLRDGSWRPRRHPVQVHVGEPLRASGAAWRDAVALRDAAREHIAAHCGEPTLAAPAQP